MKNVTEETKFLADKIKAYKLQKNNAMVMAYKTTLEEAKAILIAL